jgi:hypothetical protein
LATNMPSACKLFSNNTARSPKTGRETNILA